MTTGPHLDDETISAALDGELAGADAARSRAHLDDCTACRARAEAFGDIARAVASSDAPVRDDVRDDAIARALAAADGDAERRPRRNWTPVVAVAAVLALLLVAVPLIGSLSSDGTDDDVAAGSGRDDTALESTGRSLADEQALVDLGPVDADTLAGVVGARVGASVEAYSAPGAAADEPAPTEARDRGASGAAGGADGDTLTADRARACEPGLGADGELVLVARATWDDEPAAVLAYRSGDDVVAYVVDPVECEILQFTRFRAEP